MPKKEWVCLYDGFKVRVVNSWTWSGKISEQVFINDRLVSAKDMDAAAEDNIKDAFKKFTGSIHRVTEDINDKPYQIEVRLGHKWFGLAVGCHILVDGKRVGGDVNSKLYCVPKD